MIDESHISWLIQHAKLDDVANFIVAVEDMRAEPATVEVDFTRNAPDTERKQYAVTMPAPYSREEKNGFEITRSTIQANQGRFDRSDSGAAGARTEHPAAGPDYRLDREELGLGHARCCERPVYRQHCFAGCCVRA